MKVIIVANLKPAKLMGILSQGMVLAAKTKDDDGNERFVLSAVAGDVEPGSRVA
jgi:methionyl-tRNA synthetase